MTSATFTRSTYVGMLAMLLAFGAAQAQLRLVTDEEAKLPEARHGATRAITRGPSVKLASGHDVAANGFVLKIQFEGRGGAKVDPASIKVEYLKNPLVDVTDRVRAHVKPDGLEVPLAALPVGDHPFRVVIHDTDGRSGSAQFSLKAR